MMSAIVQLVVVGIVDFALEEMVDLWAVIVQIQLTARVDVLFR